MAKLGFLQRRWIRISLAGALIALIGLAALAWAMTGPLGRAVVSGALNGRDAAGYGVVEVEGLGGNILSEFTIARVQLRDEDGVWLTLENVRVAWSVGSVFSDTLKIGLVSIDQVEVSRRPVRDGADREAAGAAPVLDIGQLSVEQLLLADGLAGPPARYRITGFLSSDAAGVRAISVDADRTDQVGDTLRLALDRTQDGDLTGDVSILAVPGGPLANLLQLGDLGWTLEGALRGTLEAGAGDFELNIGDAAASQGTLSWRDGRWTAQAGLRPELWPALPEAAAQLVGDASLEARGAVTPFTIHTVDARSEGLRLSAFDLLAENWRAELALTPAGTALPDAFGLTLDAARARVEGRNDAQRPAFAVSVEIAGLVYDQISAEALSAQFDILAADAGYAVQADGGISGLSTVDSQLEALLGDFVNFDARLDIGDQAVIIETAGVNGEIWGARGQGRWRSQAAMLDAAANLEISSLEALGVEMAAPLSVRVATRAESAGWDRLSFQLESNALTGPDPINAILDGLAGEAVLNINPGGLELPSIRVRTNALALEAQAGQTADDARWRASGDVLFDLAAVSVEGLDGQAVGAFELDLLGDVVSMRAQVETDAVNAGAVAVQNPQLRAEAEMLDGALAGRWRFDAVGDADAITAEGRFSLQEGLSRLEIVGAQWGALRATGSAELAQNEVRAELIAAEARPSRAWALTGRYRAPLAALTAGAVEARLELADWPIATGVLTAARLELDGPLSDLPVTAEAQGRLIDPFSLTAQGELQVTQGGVELAAALNGAWGEREVRTIEPITAAISGDRSESAAHVQVGRAQINLQAADAATTQLTLAVLEAPAEVLTELAGLPPALGHWGVETELEREDGVWRGDLIVTAHGVQPVSEPSGGALSGEGRLTLADSVRFDFQAEAGGLQASASLSRSEPISDLTTLVDPGWRGEAAVHGPFDALARLYLPKGETLTAHIAGEARLGPDATTGEIRISEGAYTSRTAGVRLTPFSLTADFSGDRLRIRDAQLGDGAQGMATATGAIRLTDQGLAGDVLVRFERFNAVSQPELSVQATGDAQLVLDGRRLQISGETTLDRLVLTPADASGPDIPEIEVEEINRPESLDPPYRRPILIELDYTVRAADDLFVSSRAFSSEWSADVRVQGPLNRLTLNGEAGLLNGQATLLTRIFDMTEGRIRFLGPIDRTRILLVGEHRRAGLEVTARAEGAITQPSLSFESSPSLPEDEVLARLLFDQDAAALSPLQAAQLAAQLSGRNWLGAISSAGRRIGVDRLDIRQDDEGALAVSGGRRISDNVYVELETGTTAALGAARIEWSIRPDIVVLSRMTGDTDAELAIRWRREFD